MLYEIKIANSTKQIERYVVTEEKNNTLKWENGVDDPKESPKGKISVEDLFNHH